ncbi:hypothetical protein [Sphingobium cupriresistens]|uniref:Uncharacterized protein n=1 Tax=Sphingobium cupriresistens TaxID=1132417 RepID=A0A8G1ZGT7_9SPHN|nr:hypothetical protein [Sphingobium cupriresistens]RYM10690.1 hypothetical protein EWH12_11085 [Sphingobium cupriresistens]
MSDHTLPSTSPAVFISGSLSITSLPAPVIARIEAILERRLPVLIGDARGADRTVQRFLCERNIDAVEVYCSGEGPRNNLGQWPTRNIPSSGPKGTGAYHTPKDKAMASYASCGFVIWDGRSRGSLANIHRLAARRCFILIWFGPEERFVTLRSDSDRDSFLEAHPCRNL